MSTTRSDQGRPRLTREDVLDGREVADLLHLPVSSVLDYARRGLLPGRKLGRRWVFLRDELEVAVRAAPKAAGPSARHPIEAPARAETRPKRYPQTVPSAQNGAQTTSCSEQKMPICRHFMPMEPAGIEPATSCLQSRRSPS